ncbi:hypothetical protein B0H19DRAFT_1153366 [Mycena capillaripes]|nr:hypothetical protein B0H19DRAFT_1153366 [Mycena capillaripes]
MSDIDHNPDAVYTDAHLALFHAYADSIRKGAVDPNPPHTQYNAWVFTLRAKYGNLSTLPRFSPDYIGEVPQPVANTVRSKDGGTSMSFAEEFARKALPFFTKSSDLMLDQGARAARANNRGGKQRGQGGRFYGPRGRSTVDTYYGKGSEYGGSKSGKRDRTLSPDERYTRARHEARSRSSSLSTYRSESPGDRTPRGRRISRSPERIYRRPDSNTEDLAAKRSRERLEIRLGVFREQHKRDIDTRKRLETATKRTEATTSTSNSTSTIPAKSTPTVVGSTQSEDVEMAPAPVDLIDLATPEPATSNGKGKAKEGAAGDLDFLDDFWPFGDNPDQLPDLPTLDADTDFET